VNISLGTT